MSNTFGSAKYGNKTQYFKLKDGSQIFRVLPPLTKFVGGTGIWSQFYSVHYGYTNAEGKARPFNSPLVKNQKGMVEVPDAALERIEKLRSKLEEAKASGDEKAKERLLKLVNGQKARYNLDKNFYVNVIDLQGNIGVLKLRYKCKKQLDSQIRKLLDKGVNPLSPDNGRYFVFTREGKGAETFFNVEVYKKTENIEGVGQVERDVVHKINGELEERIKNEAVNLLKLFRCPTASDVAQIVAESNLQTGVSLNIDKILSQSSYVDKTKLPASEVKSTTVKEEPDLEEILEDEDTEVLEEPVAVKTTPVPVEKAATTSHTTSEEKLNEMSDEEFMKYIGA